MNSIISISLDSFIYAVLQAFEARSRTGGFHSHLKYTPFLENTWEKPNESNLSVFKHQIDDICQHHWNAIPHYQKHDPVNIENISWFAHSVAALFADIDFLLKNLFDHSLPQKSDKTEESIEIWSIINNAIQTHFKDYAELLEAYIEWKYNQSIEKKLPVDWNVRPPCGLLYRTEFKALFDELRNARFGKKGFNKNNKEHRKDHLNKDSAPRHEERKDTKAHSDDRKTPRKQQNRPKKPTEDNPELFNLALEECKKAIDTIKNDGNIREISLSPQNSFVRRHQHTLITDAGFDTDSRGEGAHRHVCVINK